MGSRCHLTLSVLAHAPYLDAVQGCRLCYFFHLVAASFLASDVLRSLRIVAVVGPHPIGDFPLSGLRLSVGLSWITRTILPLHQSVIVVLDWELLSQPPHEVLPSNMHRSRWSRSSIVAVLE